MPFLSIFYEFGILPFLLGMLWCRKKQVMGFHSIYVHGYMTMFSIFYLLAVPYIVIGKSLSELVRAWTIVLVAVPVVWLVQICAHRQTYIGQLHYLICNIKIAMEKLRGMMCLLAVLIVFSTVWVIPSVEDDVPEIVGISIYTDTMYVYQPYTQILYADNLKKALSPIEMLYAASAKIANMDSTVMIHMCVPIFLIPLYGAVGWMVSEYFFKDRLRNRSLFEMLWMITGTAAVCSVRALSIGILMNSWNGLTLISECILPIALIEGFALYDGIVNRKKIDHQKFLFIVMIMIAAQLTVEKGMFLTLAIMAVCLGMALIRKGYKNVGVIRKH